MPSDQAPQQNKAVASSSSSVSPQRETRVRPTREHTTGAVCCSCCARHHQTKEHHSTPTWRSGKHESRSLATWIAWPVCACATGVCLGCADEPQRRQAGARQERSAWAWWEYEQVSLALVIPETLGAGAATRRARERRFFSIAF